MNWKAMLTTLTVVIVSLIVYDKWVKAKVI